MVPDYLGGLDDARGAFSVLWMLFSALVDARLIAGRKTADWSRTEAYRSPVKHDKCVERICVGMGDERFRRTQRLRSPREFSRLRQRGRRVSGIRLTLTYARRTEKSRAEWEKSTAERGDLPPARPGNEGVPTRIGFSVNKRVGDAVTRNLVKRRLREAARHRLASLASGWDLVVTARPSAVTAEYAELAAELDHLFTRAGLWTA